METVFIVHQGSQSYLVHAIKASIKTGHKTVLIGNSQSVGSYCNNFYSDDIYLERFEIFLKNYQHLSSNSYAFELHCFKRFFLLLEYARIMDLQKFWMIDSDVILLKNLLEYANEISAGDYVASLSWQNQTDSSMSWSISPHISYWTIDALDDFVNFMIDLFLPKNISKLHQKYYFHLERKIPGGICDMTALYLWVKKGVKVYNNASSINLKPALFDHNINLSSNYSQDEFKMTPFLGIKKIRWSFKDRAFYAFHKNGGRINVVALHFQGAAKKYISRFIYFKCVSLWLCIDFIPRIIYRKLRQAWNVLWKI